MPRNPFYSTKVVYQLTDIPGEDILLSKDIVFYSGEWSYCKGDPTAEAAEESQATFDTTLTGIFSSQYASQQAQLQFLQNQMEPSILMGGQGFTASALAGMRSGVTDVNAEQYQDAQAALNEQIQANSGGSKLAGVAGSTTQADAELLQAEAQQQSSSQENITLENAQLQNQNYWNSVGALTGVAQTEAPVSYANASTSGSGAVAGLSQAVTASNQNQLLGALGGVASGAGSAIGGALIHCHIFASFFGWNDIRTWVMRMWLATQTPVWFKNFYYKHAERISMTPARWAFRPLATYVLGVA